VNFVALRQTCGYVKEDYFDRSVTQQAANPWNFDWGRRRTRNIIIREQEYALFIDPNPLQHRLPFPHDLQLGSNVGARHGQERDHDHQRPQAELESNSDSHRLAPKAS
jgi:hypothetical protein